MSRVWIIGGGFVALLVACNALNGVGDLELAADPVNGGPPGDGGPGAVADGAGPGDGGDALLPSCGASSVCVPAGAGWTPVASPRIATSPCPTAYPTATDLFSPNTFDSCSCTCTPSSPVACPAKATVAYGSFKCDTGTANVDFPADGGCTPYAAPAAAPYLAFQGGAAGASTGTVTCDAKAAPSFSPPPPVRVCAGASTSPTGCASDSLCVPAAPGSSRNCVIHDGDVPCPQGLNRRTVVGASPQDGRGCSSCACAPDGCADGKLTAWFSSSCAFGGQLLPKGNCTFTSVQALSYVPSNGCAVTTQPQVTGSVTVSGVRTLCCQ